jgi:hypothetical protein
MLTGGRGAAGLAVPGCVVTAAGLVLLFDNATGQWQTWAYAWALIVPAALGVGLWLHGQWSGQPACAARARRLAESGLVLFAGLAAFFELVLNLSGAFGAGIARYALPALLIALGAYLLLRRGGGLARPGSPA